MERTSPRGRIFKALMGGILIAVGIVGLTSFGALAGGGLDAARAADSALDNRFVGGMAGMLEDHMGFDSEAAAEWTDDMAEHMRAIHGDDAEAMLEYCADTYAESGETARSGGAGYGPSMMNGYGGGMMGPGSGMNGPHSGMMGY